MRLNSPVLANRKQIQLLAKQVTLINVAGDDSEQRPADNHPFKCNGIVEKIQSKLFLTLRVAKPTLAKPTELYFF
ncbi:hypothetical protein CCACVL1_25213 [Corchorus capsularis]|uniref:Uncharacterized protein n=1 Tax=Corchorus capsularis TaxID=210143 RepID=A0A1R3GLM1_COCAP|nr:hypothetical protein CCACVL1_25213 [Corchorus capsularis]